MKLMAKKAKYFKKCCAATYRLSAIQLERLSFKNPKPKLPILCLKLEKICFATMLGHKMNTFAVGLFESLG